VETKREKKNLKKSPEEMQTMEKPFRKKGPRGQKGRVKEERRT